MNWLSLWASTAESVFLSWFNNVIILKEERLLWLFPGLGITQIIDSKMTYAKKLTWALDC